MSDRGVVGVRDGSGVLFSFSLVCFLLEHDGEIILEIYIGEPLVLFHVLAGTSEINGLEAFWEA